MREQKTQDLKRYKSIVAEEVAVHSSKERQKDAMPPQSPARLVILLTLSIFINEAVSHTIALFISPMSKLEEALLDSALLIAMLSPMLYFFMLRPLNQFIAQRRRTEADLQLFRSLINQSNDAIFVIDPETSHFLDANDMACYNLGYKREELLNMKVIDIEAVIQDDSTWKEHAAEVRKKGSMVLEGRHRRIDGTLIPVEVNVKFISMDKKEYMVAVVRDITERRRAEEALRKAHDELEIRVQERTAELVASNEQILAQTALLRKEIIGRKWAEEALRRSHDELEIKVEERTAELSTILRTAMDGFWIVDTEGRLLEVNESYCKLTGYSREELLTMRIQDIEAQETPEETATHIRRVIETGSDRFETSHRTKDGRNLDIEVSVNHLPVGDGRLFAFLHDITERKRAEGALSESEERYRKLVELSPDIIGIHSEGRILFANSAGAKFFGVSDPSQLIGKDIFEIVHPDYHEIARGRIRKMLEEGESVPFIEVKFIKPDGSVIDVETTSVPFTYQGRTAILIIAHDITERKKTEEKLRMLLELTDRERRRADDLATELSRSNSELEQFAYVASHDLQEPLRMVSSFTQLLESRYKEKLDKDAFEFIQYIMDGATRMQNMINDLLAYSRAGRRSEPFQPTDCESVLDRVLANLKVAIEESGAAVTHDPLPSVIADATQMVQLFQNLISNAIKFHGEKTPKVHISAVQKENEWVFSVSDNGIGIAPESFERIFMMFQRLHTRKEYPGTGIGLAICKKIVERHGGRIWVESKAGEGSTFYFTIPGSERL